MEEEIRNLIAAVEALKAGTITTKQLENGMVHVTIDSVITLDQFSEIWKPEEA